MCDVQEVFLLYPRCVVCDVQEVLLLYPRCVLCDAQEVFNYLLDPRCAV